MVTQQLSGLDSLGINRNIVECKLKRYKSKIRKIAELIETLWNVNNFATGSVELKLKN